MGVKVCPLNILYGLPAFPLYFSSVLPYMGRGKKGIGRGRKMQILLAFSIKCEVQEFKLNRKAYINQNSKKNTLFLSI
jgi:hypothetical protein